MIQSVQNHLIIALTWGLTVGSAGSATPFQPLYYQAQALKGEKINLDGKLDETAWKNAHWGTDFKLLNTGLSATQKTCFAVRFDERTFYVGVKCAEADMAMLRQAVTTHDGPVWDDDCVEIFIAPIDPKSVFYHFIVNPRGTRYEERGEGGVGSASSWNGEWNAAVFKGDRFWSVEAAIPLATLEEKISEKTQWGFNVCRERYAGARELSGWSFPGNGFCKPDRFGTLAFFDFRRQDPLAGLKTEYAQMEALLQPCSPAVLLRYESEVGEIRRTFADLQKNFEGKTAFSEKDLYEAGNRSNELSKRIATLRSYLSVEKILRKTSSD